MTVHHFPIVETYQERVEGSQIDPNTNFVSQYINMRIQIDKNIQEKFSHARGEVKNKPIILSALNFEENAFKIAVLEPRVNPASLAQVINLPKLRVISTKSV